MNHFSMRRHESLAGACLTATLLVALCAATGCSDEDLFIREGARALGGREAPGGSPVGSGDVGEEDARSDAFAHGAATPGEHASSGATAPFTEEAGRTDESEVELPPLIFDQRFCSVFCEAVMQCDDTAIVGEILDRHRREREFLSSFDLCWSICLATEFRPIEPAGDCLRGGGNLIACMNQPDAGRIDDYCEAVDDSWRIRVAM